MFVAQIFACVIAIFEFAFLRRKLAVDENVSDTIIYQFLKRCIGWSGCSFNPRPPLFQPKAADFLSIKKWEKLVEKKRKRRCSCPKFLDTTYLNR